MAALLVSTTACKPDSHPSTWSEQKLEEWFDSGQFLNGLSLIPDPSIDRRSFALHYYDHKETWDKAFAFLKNTDLNALPVGRVDLGGQLYANVSEYEPKDREGLPFEAHKGYIDIQYVVEGYEAIDIAPLEKTTVTQPYNAEIDALFCTTSAFTELQAKPGRFFIFFPEEAHRPGMKDGDESISVRKVVVKVPIQNVVMQLIPGEDNPRNSEGDFITLKNGRILFIYSHYTGTSNGDHDPAYLAGRFSDDGGKTWSNDDFMVVANEGVMNVMSVSLLRLQNGNIALFYLRKNSEEDCIPMMRISTDEAKTWSSPVACITDRKGYFVLNNNRVIQLKNGRLLMAVALHEKLEGAGFNGNGRIFAYYSDDNGAIWHRSDEVSNPSQVTAQEPGVVELKDGTVMMYIRATGGFQQLSWSKDKGQTWSPMVAGAIPSPLSPASIARIPSTGDLLLVWNNNDGSNPQTAGKRTPLTVAVSKDEGKSWEHIRNIETDPNGWFCYIAIHFTKEDVLLSYCTGPPQYRHLSVTNVMKIPQKDLLK